MTDQPLPVPPPAAPPGGPQSQYHSHVAMETFSQHYQEAILSLKRRMLAEEAALEAMGLDRAGLYGPPPMSGGSTNPLLPVSSSSMPGPRGAEAGEDGGMSGGHPGVGGGGPGGGVTGAHPGPPPVVSAANSLHGPQTSDMTSPTTTTSSTPGGQQHHYHPGYHHPGGGGGGGGGGGMTPHHPADPLYGLLPGPGAGPPGGAPRTSRPDHDDDLDGSPTEHHLHHHQHHYPHHPHHHQGAITPMQEFVNKSNLHQHSKEVHRMQEKMHKCVKCFKSFPSSQQLTQHMLVHNNIRKYKCQYCDKAFKQLSHVQQHQRRHTGERPYKCTIEGCDKAFAQLSNLQQHQRNHDARRQQSDRKPYQCSICDRRFATEVSLNNHISKVHNPDSPAFLVPAPGPALSAAPSPSSAVAMVTAAGQGGAASVTSSSAGLPLLPLEGLPPLLTGPPLHLRLPPPAAAAALEKALVREAISAALAATHAHQQHQQNQQQQAELAAAATPPEAETEAEDADGEKMTPRRRMEELSKRDLNLLRFSRAGLYDFPTQVPPLHHHHSMYAARTQLPP